MLIGENGIITQAQNAKEQSEIGEEKEAISVAYSGAKIKNEGTDVTANDMQEQFNYNETKANASGNIKVQFTESKRWYSIDGSGNIEGPFESEDEIVTDGVNIVISKTPESKPSGVVILKVEKVEGLNGDVILKETNMSTKFEKAYIYHEGKIIDITKCIIEENGIYSIYGGDIHQQKIGIENGEVKTFILIKDEICYIGNAIVVWPE